MKGLNKCTSVKWAERIVIILMLTAREPNWEAAWRQRKYWERRLGWWYGRSDTCASGSRSSSAGQMSFSTCSPGGPASVGRLLLICMFPNSRWLTFVMTVLLNGLRPNLHILHVFWYCVIYVQPFWFQGAESHSNWPKVCSWEQQRSLTRNEEWDHFRTRSNYFLKIYTALFLCMLLWGRCSFLFSCCLFLSFSPWLVFPAYWPCTWPPPPTLSWPIRLNIHCQLAMVSCVLGQIQEGVRLPNFLEFIWVLGCLWETCMASQSAVRSLG